MFPANRHLVIRTDIDFHKTIYYRTIPRDDFRPSMTEAEYLAASTPVDTSGWTEVEVHGRTEKEDAATVFEMSLTGGEITLGVGDGGITLELSDSVTGALTPGTGFWDLVYTDASGGKWYRVGGTYEITRTVTHD